MVKLSNKGKEMKKRSRTDIDKSKTRKKFICKSCGKYFNCKNILETHRVFAHTKPFHYSCYKCGEKFQNSVDIAIHTQNCSSQKRELN